MKIAHDDSQIRRALAPERSIESRAADAALVVARLNAKRHPRAKVVVVGFAVAVALAAAPPVQAVVGGLASEFGSYFANAGDSAGAPGRPAAPSDSPPPWLSADGRSGQRLLAESHGHALYVVREPSGSFGFALDGGVGISDTRAGWERQFADNDAVVLGPASKPDAGGLLALFGVSSEAVKSVQVSYASGPPTGSSAGEGGFVAMVDVARGPVALSVFDGTGRALQQLDLRPLHLALTAPTE